MENIVEKDEAQRFAELMKEAGPTIKVLFETIQMRHSDNAPAAVLACASLLHIILQITMCPIKPNELSEMVSKHLDFAFYPESHSNETH
jgi:hypothetical protein